MACWGLPEIPDGAYHNEASLPAGAASHGMAVVDRTSGLRVKRARRAPEDATFDGLPTVPGETWQRGANVPHVARGNHNEGVGVITPAMQAILGNIHCKLGTPLQKDKVSEFMDRWQHRSKVVKLFDLIGFLLEAAVPHIPLIDAVVAELTCMQPRTVSNTLMQMRHADWSTLQPREGGRPPKPKVESCASAGGKASILNEDIPDGLAEDLWTDGSAHSAVATIAQMAPPSVAPDPIRAVGLRLGSLAARMYTDPHLPISAFTPLVSWIDEHAPGSLGNINHGLDFALRFGRCMGAHLQTCLALQHWQTIPALRIPSDFLRVIDGYTCLGEPLLVLVHVLTTSEGNILPLLVDTSPNAASAVQTGRGRPPPAVVTPPAVASTIAPPTVASTSAPSEVPYHRWKSGGTVAEHVALLESGFAISLSEAGFRHAATAADGAYIGPHSNQLMAHYTALLLQDGGRDFPHVMQTAMQQGDTLWEAACEFHSIQKSTALADKQFRIGRDFDDALRALRQRTTFGAGRTVARGVAAHFGVKWLQPLAPRGDDFKVTGYSRHAAGRFVYLYCVLHGALEVELEAVCMLARHMAQQRYIKRLAAWEHAQGAHSESFKPKPPGADVGLGLQACRVIRELGRTITSPQMLVFGLGRHELRDQYMAAYAVLTQDYKVSAMVKVAEQHRLLMSMNAAVDGLVALSGALRMLHTLAWGQKKTGRWHLGRAALRHHIKVFCGHYAWRHIPIVANAIPDILLPRQAADPPTFQGVALHNLRFEEPQPRRASGESYEQRRASWMEERLSIGQHGRWADVSMALTDLARWLRMEAIWFRRRVLLWDSQQVGLAPQDR